MIVIATALELLVLVPVIIGNTAAMKAINDTHKHLVNRVDRIEQHQNEIQTDVKLIADRVRPNE